MLSKEDNEILCRVGPGTPAGELFRRYWLPVGISSEVQDVPKKVRILGEDLVLFRDDRGRPGLLGIRCPHRLTMLDLGRVEAGGLRCCYHGWLFDVSGRCLEQPGEPAGSSFKESIRHLSYPCRDHGGLVFMYMGPGEPPLLPNFEILMREDGTRRAAMDWMVHPCNYLQLVENDMDPWHAAILHGDSRYSQNSLFPNRFTRADFEETEIGVMYTGYRPGAVPGTQYVRRVNSIMPLTLGFGGGKSVDYPDAPEFGGSLRWRVPMDDTHTAFFSVYFTPFQDGRPVETPHRDMGGIFVPREIIQRSLETGEWEVERDADGRYVLDDTWKEDYVAIVSQGAVVDRNAEHLGHSDRGVILIRKMYMIAIKEVQEGRDPKGIVRDPAKNEVIKLPTTNMIVALGGGLTVASS